MRGYSDGTVHHGAQKLRCHLVSNSTLWWKRLSSVMCDLSTVEGEDNTTRVHGQT